MPNLPSFQDALRAFGRRFRYSLPVPALSVEPTQGPWSNNAHFGGRFQGDLPPEEGTEINIIGNDDMPGPPKPRTVHLFRSDRNITASGNADVRCRLIYGAGGVNNDVLLDWHSGTQFSVVASTLRVNFQTYAPRNVAYSPVSNVVLGATVGSYAPSQGGLAPTFTEPFQNLAGGGGSANFPVPDHAKAFSIAADVIFGAVTMQNILIAYRSIDAVSVYFVSAASLLPNIVAGKVPLPGWVNSLLVINNNAGAVPFGMIYHLQL